MTPLRRTMGLRQPIVDRTASRRAWRQRLRATTALQAAAAVALLAAPMAARAQPAPNARPTGGVVTAGQASIAQTTATTTVTQSSQRAAVNWNSFDVGSQHTVDFNQPSSSAVTLNRVVGPDPSQIAGHINANGQIVVVNQAGVVFDRGAQVNTAGIVVSAAGISDRNFMAGKMVFDQPAKPNAKIVNRGTITVRDTGLAALVAPQVRNSGTIQAKLGTVILAGAETDTLDLYGDGLVSINVTKQVHTAPNGAKVLVTNTGDISARGGVVELTASAVDGVVQTLVDAGGHITADSTAGRTGQVLVSGTGGDVVVTGTISAAGKLAGTTGGAVMVAGDGATVLAKGSRVTVSGKAGGGTVAIGTTLARANGGPSVTAPVGKSVTVQKGATITANATSKGQGGRVVLLSSGTTEFDGAIAAKGGKQGGDGGFVEISGSTASLTGQVNTMAPAGNTGTLLLDPTSIWISDTKPSLLGISWYSPATLESEATNIVLSATGSLNVASSFGTGNTLALGGYSLTLGAGAGLTVDQGFSISARSVQLTASGGAITLNGASGVVGGLITTSQLAALPATNLQLTAANSVALTAANGIALGAATIGSALDPVATLSLSATTGGVSQSAAGAIFADTLQSSGVTGTVSLMGTGNQIAAVPSFAVKSGDFDLVDAGPLTVGTVSGTDVFLQVGAGDTLTVGPKGQIIAGFSSGDIVTLLADLLDVGAGSKIGASIVQIAPVTAGRPVSLVPATPPADTLVLDSTALSAVDATILRIGAYAKTAADPVGTPSAGSIDIASSIKLNSFADVLDLRTTGAITQEAPLGIGTLTGAAGSVKLTNTGNTIGALGAFDVDGGDFTLVNNIALAVTGAIAADNVFLELAKGLPLTIDTGASLAAGTAVGDRATMVADTLTVQSGAKITAPTVEIAPTTPTLGISLLPTALPSGSLALNGTVLSAIKATTLRLGAYTDAAHDATTIGTPISGNITIASPANLAATAGILDAETLGVLGGPGSLAVPTLSGNVGTLTLTASGNDIAALGPLHAATGMTLNDGTHALDIVGTVSTPGQIAVTAGPITQSAAGIVTAHELTGSAGGVDLSAATNDIATLGPFSPGGNFALNNGSNSLQFTGAFSGAGDTLTLTAGAITQTSAGIVAAADLTGSAAGVDLTTATNDIATLGPFAPGGNFALNNGGNKLQFTGAFSGAGDTLTLTGGAITQTAAGIVTVGELTGSAAGVDLSTTVNDIATLGPFSPGGNFVLNNGSNPLQFTGAFSGTGDTLTLNAGAITQTAAGTVTVAELTGSAAGVDLSIANNDIATLGPFAPGGNFALNNSTNPLEFVGAFSGTGDTLTLHSGAITQTAAGTVTAGELAGAANGVDLTAATNNIAALGAFTPGGDFSLNNGTNPLQFVGAFSGAGDTLTLTAGAITQTSAGAITAGELTGSAAGVDLGTATNDIATLGPFAPGGNFALNNGANPLEFIGAFSGAGDTLTLTAGAITQTSAGAITAGELTGSAASVDLATATNDIATLGPFAPGGNFALNNGANPLAFVGAFSGAGDTLTLTAGAVTQTPAGVITAQEFTGSAAGVDLSTATNDIATLGPFTSGDFALNNGTNPLEFIGAFSGGTLALTTGAITQTSAGAITAGELTGSAAGVDLGTATNDIATLGAFAPGGDFTLNNSANPLQFVGAFAGAGDTLTLTAGAVTQTPAGTITAQELTGSATSVDLTEAAGGNFVAVLGPFTTAGSFALNDAEALTVSGAVTGGTGVALTLSGASSDLAVNAAVTAPAGDVDLTAGRNITLAADVSAPAGTISLIAPGTVDQVGGTLTAAILSGPYGTPAASASLPDANAIGALGTFVTTGNFFLNDTIPLDVFGLVRTTAPSSALGITDTALLSLGGGELDAGSGAGALTLQTGGVAGDNGTVIAGTLSGTFTGPVSLGNPGNAVPTILGLRTTGTGNGLTFVDGVGLTVAGPVSSSGQVTLTVLGAGNPLAQNSTITAMSDASLTAQDGLLLQQGTVDAAGNATLTGGTGLIQSGTVDAAGQALLIATDGTLQQSGSVTGGTGVTLLAENGPVVQTSGGVVTAITGPIFVQGEAGVLQLGTVVTDPGDVTIIASNGTLEQDGTVTAMGGAATLTAQNGPLDQTGMVTGDSVNLTADGPSGLLTQSGTLTATTGQVSLTADAGLTQSGNITAAGTIYFTIGGGTLQQSGNLTGGTGVDLVDTGGLLIQTASGTTTALTGTILLQGQAGLTQQGHVLADAGDVTLTAVDGTLEQDGVVTATGGAATLSALNGQLNQTRQVTGNTVFLAADGNNGNLSQSGSVLSTNGSVTMQAGADLMQTGTVTAQGGDASLTAANNLTQASRIVASDTIELTASNGTLSQTGSLTATAGDAMLTAGRNLSQTGTINAGTAAIIESQGGNVTQGGTTTAPNIQLATFAAGGSILFSGSFAGVDTYPGLDPAFRLSASQFPGNIGFGAYLSGANVTIASSAHVAGAGGGPAALVVAGQNSVQFGDFNNPTTQLYLDLGTGVASGQIEVATLQVRYIKPGTNLPVSLTGAVDGLTGYTAASASFILPVIKNNYQLNGCPIQSTSCIRISTIVLPTINPLKDLDVMAPQGRGDFDIGLPDVGEKDY